LKHKVANRVIIFSPNLHVAVDFAATFSPKPTTFILTEILMTTNSLQVFHAELHTFKHHIELFNQLTQKLIAVYPTDDVSRIKRVTESINLR
jgi:hypothetical protein